MALQYKKNTDGFVELSDEGHPLVFDDQEDEPRNFPLDAIHLYSKVPTLQAEAKKYRESRDQLQSKLGMLGDDVDPEDLAVKLKVLGEYGDITPQKAKEAQELLNNLKDVDEKNAIQIEKVKAGVAESYESKIRDIDAQNQQRFSSYESDINRKDAAIRNLLIKGAFDRNEFIKERTVLTPDIAYDSFGKFFTVEEGDEGLSVHAVDRSGEKIFSKAKPGEYAAPDEAIELIISDYPQKDNIIRTTSGGSNAGGNASGGHGNRQKMAELASMPAGERLKALRR
jgi:hypothetical protein